ncbi:hypothetical protein FB451DRAFT_1177575 [Mycena latifolia]|nr:hypothetical protein FB451DRAFT_1177575 [Mycena latifolia]
MSNNTDVQDGNGTMYALQASHVRIASVEENVEKAFIGRPAPKKHRVLTRERSDGTGRCLRFGYRAFASALQKVYLRRCKSPGNRVPPLKHHCAFERRFSGVNPPAIVWAIPSIPGGKSPGNSGTLLLVIEEALLLLIGEELHPSRPALCSLVSAATVKRRACGKANMSVSAARTMIDAPCVLPEGPLYGHYSDKGQLYTVHSGSPHIVLNTPSPEEARAIDSSTMIPLFRQPQYLSPHYPYLLFIPKNYAWRDELFKTFSRPRHKLPIVSDREHFYLHPDIAGNWLELENCLHALGKEMLELAPQGWLPRIVYRFFFPARFKFLQKFRSEKTACFAAWHSIDNFLPLLGYVSMGIWCMQCWESAELARGADPPDWRFMVTDRTKVHPTFLDYVEKSVVGNWNEERVGAFYRIQAPEDVHGDEREQRREIKWLLATILHSNFPIPIYLSWGRLPRQMSSSNVPMAFQEFVPNTNELKYLASLPGQVVFSRWAVDKESLKWYQDRSTPASTPIVPAPPSPPLPPDNEPSPSHQDSSPAAVAPAPFPPLPAHSKQRKNETIQGFFIRRREANMKKIAKESPTDRQRRTQRTDHAKRGEAPMGTTSAYPGGRGNYNELWREYPGPQRRFDPISNEWDLCELFEDNDPVFGESYAVPSYDDDDDDDDEIQHPTFPQNIDMASLLSREDDHREVQKPPPYAHDLEMASIDDVPEDLGPDFRESDVPKRNLIEASRRCVNLVYLKFGLAPPRTEKPEYKSSGGDLLGTLERRFGFVMPPSPEKFVARDPPQVRLNSQLLANVVGMTDIGGQLASEKGLANILDIFFGQCIEARSLNDIDRALLDYHRPSSPRVPSPFEIRREYLKSMRNPSQEGCYYYVLRQIGRGLGSEALLIPRATDFIEVLRQQWGPEIKDVVGHFLARGIPFWLAYVALLLQYGGVIGRLARSEVSDEDFFRGYSDDIYDVGDCLWDGTSPYAYWHDRLSTHEIDLLCGVYHVGTGQKKKGKARQGHGQGESEQICTDQTGIVSWWPKPSARARGSLDGAWWTPQCEEFFQKRLSHFEKGVYILPHQSEWRHNLKFKKDVKKCWDGYKRVAVSMVQGFVDMGAIAQTNVTSNYVLTTNWSTSVNRSLLVQLTKAMHSMEQIVAAIDRWRSGSPPTLLERRNLSRLPASVLRSQILCKSSPWLSGQRITPILSFRSESAATNLRLDCYYWYTTRSASELDTGAQYENRTGRKGRKKTLQIVYAASVFHDRLHQRLELSERQEDRQRVELAMLHFAASAVLGDEGGTAGLELEAVRHSAVRPKENCVLGLLAHRILGNAHVDVVRAPALDFEIGGVEYVGGQSPFIHRSDEAGLEPDAEVQVPRALLLVGRRSQAEKSAILGFGGEAATRKAMSGLRERRGGQTAHMRNDKAGDERSSNPAGSDPGQVASPVLSAKPGHQPPQPPITIFSMLLEDPLAGPVYRPVRPLPRGRFHEDCVAGTLATANPLHVRVDPTPRSPRMRPPEPMPVAPTLSSASSSTHRRVHPRAPPARTRARRQAVRAPPASAPPLSLIFGSLKLDSLILEHCAFLEHPRVLEHHAFLKHPRVLEHHAFLQYPRVLEHARQLIAISSSAHSTSAASSRLRKHWCVTQSRGTSLQNIYETTQLYAAGTLCVACLGLQCVGFNKAMYGAVCGAGGEVCARGQVDGHAAATSLGWKSRRKLSSMVLYSVHNIICFLNEYNNMVDATV